MSMPRADYTDRQLSLLLPSHAMREQWRELATKDRKSLTKWICDMVEARLLDDSEPAQEIESQNTSLLDDNRRLRRDREKSEARIRELETEVFRLRHSSFLMDIPPQNDYSERLVDALRSGGTWSGRDLLQELGVNQADADAIQIVSRQLHALQDFKLVSENPRGWKWIK